MKNYKIGLFVFLFLATIISLFPPFEWGNEKIKTERERIKNRNILESLPIKKYDFLFASNKKYFPIGSYKIEREVYSGETINIDTTDIISREISTGVDTFFLNKYKVKKSLTLRKDDVWRCNNSYMKGGKNYNFNFVDLDLKGYERDRYNEIKKRTGNADTIQHYKIHKLVKPYWFLLKRELILNELILQYLLAGFIAFFVQIISTFARRKMLNEK